ncbi:hypothetical protein SAMN05421595_2606 [Austwickia chelonae]|uniref:Uncharacterized protein n=1 Tax=Austwickia chelonae NBRC 105200 TaxID=1184607 RepID=K6WBT8_9MICO|nr:hypothetical protein [Austwickia chelonae]GAB79297.1 hypothetical protein AUCHE_22_00670 [Austwickia chelonae NBRC 105200]SEW38027.1 hypothetical protein SAMN05421595_2606 [Austwickia chelonae]
MTRRGSIASWSLAGVLLLTAAAPAVAQVRTADRPSEVISTAAPDPATTSPLGETPGTPPHTGENPTAGQEGRTGRICTAQRRKAVERRTGRARRDTCPRCDQGPVAWRLANRLIHRWETSSRSARNSASPADRRAHGHPSRSDGRADSRCRPVGPAPHRGPTATEHPDRSPQRQAGELVQRLLSSGLRALSSGLGGR